MSKKQIVAGVTIGVAALTALGILLYRNRSKKSQLRDAVQDATDNFRGKLNKLERKARKEYRQLVDEGQDFANTAKDRAGQWVNKTGANL